MKDSQLLTKLSGYNCESLIIRIVYVCLLSRTDKAFEVFVFALHQSVVDIAQPQLVGSNEA